MTLEPVKMLIVHHSREHADELSIFFDGQGYETTQAPNGAKAKAQLTTYDYDAVIMSMLLPDRNGLELCREIKRDKTNTKIKVIILSSIPQGGRFAVEARTKFLADGYIEEPITLPDLLDEVNAITGFKPPEKESKQTTRPAYDQKSDIYEESTDPFLEKFGSTVLDVESQTDFNIFSNPEVTEETSRVFSRPTKFSMETEGTLGDVLFPELLLYLYQLRATGSLVIKVFSEERIIYFADGIPQFIRTNFIHEESLGQILIRRKRITPARLKQILRQAKQSGRMIGDMLADQGFLKRHELNQLLKRQARFKLVNVFKLTDGSYVFRPGKIQRELAVRLDTNIIRVLHAGILRHVSLEILEKKIFNNRDRVIVRKRIERVSPGDLGLSRQQWALIGLADGERTLADIITDSKLNFKTTFQTIYLMFLFGIFNFKDGQSNIFQLEEPVLARAVAEAKSLGGAAVAELEEQTELPTAGDLSQTPLTLLLYRLTEMEETGILSIVSEESEEKVVLLDGSPAKIETIGKGRLVLGKLLVEQGYLSSDQRDQALDEAMTAERPLGEILIKNGMISPHQIFEILQMQIERKLKFIFNLKSGHFAYNRIDKAELAGEMGFDVDIARLAVKAMKDNADPRRLEQDMLKYKGFVMEITTSNRQKLERLFTDPRESQIIDLINGRRSLAQILERSPLKTEKAMTAVFVLLTLKLARFIQD